MTMPGFRGTTYEVLTGDGSRWVIAQICRAEQEARGLADQLLSSGKHAAVRITAKRDGSGAENVIFEQAGEVSEKPIKPFTVASAPVCATVEDCLRYPARLAIGRVGRAYLDERGITPAEFLVSAGDLIAVERRDTFFMNAIHVLAKAQSGDGAKSAADRADALFRLHSQLRDRVRELDDTDELQKAVSEKGLAALPVGNSDAAPTFEALSCLTGIMSYGGSWPGRVAEMLDLLEMPGGSAAARGLADELIAEAVDGAEAISELMGGLRGPGEACTNLTALATGTGNLPKYANEAAHRLHAMMAKTPLRATQNVLLERVARVLSGIKPLTESGSGGERRLFMALVPKLLDPAGTLGGGSTAEALTLRAKMALGGSEELPMNEAIGQLQSLFPTRAVRLGYLLDLMGTPTGEKYAAPIKTALVQLIGQLRSVRDLVPQGTSHDILLAVVEALRARLAMGSLPDELRGALAASLERLLAGGGQEPEPGSRGSTGSAI